jgi:HEPN domain-containing protein
VNVPLPNGASAVNRKQLQTLAKERLKDAKALIARKRWSAAYYLTGYIIECALKSCVLRHLDATGKIFSDRDYLKRLGDCWTHNLKTLVNLAGLDAAFGPARSANPALAQNWTVVTEWDETSRYKEKTEAEARRLYEAVTHDPDGVLQWIQSHW